MPSDPLIGTCWVGEDGTIRLVRAVEFGARGGLQVCFHGLTSGGHRYTMKQFSRMWAAWRRKARVATAEERARIEGGAW